MNTKTNKTVAGEIGNYDNEQLRNLLIEIRTIGDSDAPAKAKQSQTMKKLFDIEKQFIHVYWRSIYDDVRGAIERTILYRICNNQW